MDKELLITVAQEFVSRKIIVEPESEDEAREFLDGCLQAGIIDEGRSLLFEDAYRVGRQRGSDNTCFRSNTGDPYHLVKYGTRSHYEMSPEYNDYEFVKYSDFVEYVCGTEEEYDVSGFDEIMNAMV